MDITPPIGSIIRDIFTPGTARACWTPSTPGPASSAKGGVRRLVTADCCGLYRSVTDQVRRRVADRTPSRRNGSWSWPPTPTPAVPPQLGRGGADRPGLIWRTL